MRLDAYRFVEALVHEELTRETLRIPAKHGAPYRALIR
jgi:hypothetical protein